MARFTFAEAGIGMPSARRVGEWSETFEHGVNQHPHLILYVLSVILYVALVR